MCEDDVRDCTFEDGRDEQRDVGEARAGDQFSGFVIVRLADHVGPAHERELAAVCEKHQLTGLARVLGGIGWPASRRVVTSVDVGELLAMEKQAGRAELPPLHSLTSYWRIDLRDVDSEPETVVRLLNQLPEVDLAYRELAATDPTVNAADDTWNAGQDYEDAAPDGIDARWAWLQPNGEGAGVAVVDLEQGWIPTHEDLAGKSPTLVFGTNRHGVGTYVGDHGTAVLGEIVGIDNTRGVVGIAPACTSVRMVSHFDGTTTGNVADAIVAVIPSMAPGDVLLLEIQRAFLPTETDAADLDAIRLAVSRGIVVVEAAGNGNANLDTWTDGAAGTRLNRGSAAFVDSGAIMVGASRSALPHNRWASSNFGSRIDCYAWGENVTTCGYGDLAGTSNDTNYTATFQGTSSASPIIVGAAMLLQSMYRGATGGATLSPLQMRSRLANPATGTAQGGGVAGNIGVMPNLRAIAETALNLVPDVYLRDAVGDDGRVPSAGAISTSPDVIVRPAAVANPTASFGEGSGTENDETLGATVEAGQDNVIYVRMRNRGGATATNVTVTVWWSQVSTLVTPGTWQLIGTTAPVAVPTGDTLVVAGPLTWPRANVPPDGTHACFVAIANAPNDGAPPLPAAYDWNGFTALIRNHNNVTWRNFNVDDVLADPNADPTALAVVVRGAPDEAREFDLEVVQQVPEDVRVDWVVPPALFRLLPAALRREAVEAKGEWAVPLPRLRSVRLCDVRLPKDAEFATRFLVHPGKGLARGRHTVAIRQVWEGLEVGRVTWALRVPRRRGGKSPAVREPAPKRGRAR